MFTIGSLDELFIPNGPLFQFLLLLHYFKCGKSLLDLEGHKEM